MVTPAPLTAVSLITTNTNTCMHSLKRKDEKTHISEVTRQSILQQSDGSSVRTIPTFRIPKIPRSNDSNSSQDTHLSSLRNERISSAATQVSNTKFNLSSNEHSNDDSNSQSGKRKFSLSQYKEHKRLKSTDTTVNCSADVDMRIENLKNSPPSDSSNHQPVVLHPKSIDIRRDLVLKSNLTEPGVKKLIKKKVIWADENNRALVQTSIFEIEESEMADMHVFARQCATNISIAQVEKLMDRDLCQRQNLHDISSWENDDRQNLPPLPNLIRILLPETIPIPLVKSQERHEQEEREKTVLQALLMRSFLPDCPGEPDDYLLESNHRERNEPKAIPLDDSTSAVESNEKSPVNETDSISTNVSTTLTTPSLSSLLLDNMSPEVAQIFAQAKGNLTAATVNTPTLTVVNTPISQPTAIPAIDPTLAPISNFTTASSLFSVLLNIARSNGNEIMNVPPANPPMNPLANLPFNFNMSTPSMFSMNQLAANVLSLGLLPTPATTTSTNPVFSSPMYNSMTNSSSGRFVPPSGGQQRPRFNQNKKEHYLPNSRGNNRGRVYRRGLHNHTNTDRRDYYQNRNNNQRNLFS